MARILHGLYNEHMLLVELKQTELSKDVCRLPAAWQSGCVLPRGRAGAGGHPQRGTWLSLPLTS